MKKPRKKPVTRKKSPRKRSKIHSDTIKAFQLAGILLVVSIAISYAIIKFQTGEEPANKPQEIAVPEQKQETKKPEPVAVIVDEPAKNTGTEPVRSVPAATPITPTPAPTTATVVSSRSTATTTGAKTTASSVTRTEHKGTLVFVIDDAGNNLAELDPFLRIPGPLTIAVLPGLPHSAEAARRIRAAGKEVILHQPMEALGGQNPGPSAIYSNMSAQEIRTVLEKNIAEVGHVKGMNNHQGSKITQDRQIMEVILAFCEENNLYFLDSRTTADTVVPAGARQMGIKIAERDVFLDNDQSKESMQRYLTIGMERAQRNGHSVMIGHTWSPALAPLLAEQFTVLTIQGYTIKNVSDIIR